MEYYVIVCPKCGRLHEVPANIFERYNFLRCSISMRWYPTSRAKVICRKITLT